MLSVFTLDKWLRFAPLWFYRVISERSLTTTRRTRNLSLKTKLHKHTNCNTRNSADEYLRLRWIIWAISPFIADPSWVNLGFVRSKTANTTWRLRFTPMAQSINYHTLDKVKANRLMSQLDTFLSLTVLNKVRETLLHGQATTELQYIYQHSMGF